MYVSNATVPDLWQTQPSDRQHVIDVCNELKDSPKVSPEDQKWYREILARYTFAN
jgi:hypothetical protein